MVYLKSIVFIFFFISINNLIAEEKLNKFSTDYCTGFPEGTISRPDVWKHCCLIHDLYFWAGGTKSERDEADFVLKSCVEDTEEIFFANLIYFGVRTGRLSPYKIPEKQWGNGWPLVRRYQALKVEDINQIESELLKGHRYISTQIKDQFIKALRAR